MEFLKSLIFKRAIVAITGAGSVVIGNNAAHQVAALLTDPDFINAIFSFLGTGLMIWSAFMGKDAKKAQDTLEQVHHTVNDFIPPRTDVDPYPGYDWDPVKGWVKVGEQHGP